MRDEWNEPGGQESRKELRRKLFQSTLIRCVRMPSHAFWSGDSEDEENCDRERLKAA